VSYRVFVDANVWYPPSPRALFLGAAMAGAFEVATSQQVLNEMHRNIAAKKDEDTATLRTAQLEAQLLAVRQSAVIDVVDFAPTEALGLPDPDDEHVVAGALAAGADGILTFNVKDFPESKLEAVGLELCRPDQFAFEGLRGRHPAWVEAVRHALTFPPAAVQSAADLGSRLYDCGMPDSAGVLFSADWAALASPLA
jgi:predicted nucleic acid-binding protein